MKFRTDHRTPAQAGYTLLTTLMLTGAITAILAASMTRTMTEEKLNDREGAWVKSQAAAEAATEKVMARMMVDFANGGEASLSNNMSVYRSTIPTTSENSFWTNLQFSDGNGTNNAVYVSRTTTQANPPYVTLLQQYPGLNAFASTYRVLSNAKYTNNGYNVTGVVQQDLQMAEIPVFQFAIFYNSLLEFSDCATMTVNGRVHCNTNINVGTTSGNSLTFNYLVSSSGIITNPPALGISSWASGNIHYNGSPNPGYGTGEAILTLPIGTNSSSPSAVREIINPPPLGESQTNPISSQRYYNKAWLVILITNAMAPVGTNLVTITNCSTNLYTNSVTVYVKNTIYDSSPLVFAVTNGVTSGTNSGVNFTQDWVNWTNTGINAWLTTSTNFYDEREGRWVHCDQIDVGKLGLWISNYTGLTTKWGGATPFNGIVYLQDARTTNASWINAVRLVNGVNITNGLYSSGLTMATQNPLYIWSFFNCPSATTNQGTTNTLGCRPCSIASDALTILSSAWTDGPSTNADSVAAHADTVNTAIITGNVPTTDTTTTGFSGGVHNLPRLLENWSGITLTLNSSIICLYNSVQAAKQFQAPGIYYNAPTRQFSFDLNFTNSAGLPPGTPLIDRMIRADWGIAPPNTVTYYSPTLDFVPH